MVTREQSLKRFLEKADDVINGKYLFAAKKIEEMLLSVSTSRILFEIFEYCCTGEDTAKLKAKYMYADGTPTFTMPENKKQAVALCFCVLKEIVSGETDFNTLLTKHFPSSESFLDSYAMFINFLVVPFRNVVNNMAETVISASRIKETRETSAVKCDLDVLYLKGLISYLEEDRRSIVEAGIREGSSKDAVYVINEMIESAKDCRIDRLKTLFIAYKHTVSQLKRISTHCDEVEEMLADHGVI